MNHPAALPDPVNLFEENDKNTLRDLSLSLKNSYSFNKRNQFYFGALLRRHRIYYHKDAGGEYVYDNIKQQNTVASMYLLDKIKLNDLLTFKPGIRLSYYQGTGKLYAEPRAALGLDVSPRTSMRVAVGRYYQYISQVVVQQETGYIKNFWVLADGKNYPVLKSDHLVIGGDLKAGNFLFDIEAYYKRVNGIQEYFYISHLQKNSGFDRYFPKNRPWQKPPDRKPSFFIQGVNQSDGLDFLVQYKRRNYSGWVSYSLGQSLNSFGIINGGREIPSQMDQLHQLSMVHLFSWRKWNFGSVTMYGSGSPYYRSELNETYGSVTRYVSRLPGFFRTDLSANYTLQIEHVRLKLGASLINVFNTRNYYDSNTRDFNFETSTFTQINLIRSGDRSLNLFLHFEI
jgi:hypothetical protein